MYIYNVFISLIVTEIRDGVGIRSGSVIGDFPLHNLVILNFCYNCIDKDKQGVGGGGGR